MNATLSRRALLKGIGIGLGGMAAARNGMGFGPAYAQAAPVTLQLWTHDQGYIKFFTEQAAAYSSQRGAKFAIEVVPTQAPVDQIITKALAAYAAGQSVPDLLGIEVKQFSRFMSDGVAEAALMDLTDRVAPVRDQYFEQKWAAYTANDRIYGVESAYCLCAACYRHDVFEELGIVGQFENLGRCSKIANNMLKPKGMYAGIVPTTGEGLSSPFLLHLHQRGGALFNAAGEMTLDSPEAVEVLEFLNRGLRDEIFLGVSDMFGGPTAAALKQGKIALTAGAGWFETYILKPNAPDDAGKWRIQPLPRFASGGSRTSIFGGTGFAISKNAANAEAAMELLNYAYLTPEGQKKRYKVLTYLPTCQLASTRSSATTVENTAS